MQEVLARPPLHTSAIALSCDFFFDFYLVTDSYHTAKDSRMTIVSTPAAVPTSQYQPEPGPDVKVLIIGAGNSEYVSPMGQGLQR
jgi:hypothetical protein